MFNRRTLAFLMAGAFALAGCTTSQQTDDLPRELRQSSVVSTSTPEFAPQPGSTLAWRNDLHLNLSPGVEANADQVATIKAELERQLQQKGYRFAAAGNPVTYQLEGVLILGDKLNETQLRDALGFDPGLVGDDSAYQKGSLLVFLIDPASLRTQWLGVVQIFAAPDLPAKVREERIQFAINLLMNALPAPGTAQ